MHAHRRECVCSASALAPCSARMLSIANMNLRLQPQLPQSFESQAFFQILMQRAHFWRRS